MKAGLLDRLRAQFRTQSLRGEDVALWWQLPDDNHRVASPWKQLVVDLVQPPTFSQWHTKVAAARITHYDGLRGPVTRTGYLAVVASAMAAVGAPWWIWVLLVPAVMQVALEFLAYPYPSRGPERRRTSRILPARYERLQGNLNIPALIGLLADPLNLIAVNLAPSGGDVGWVKIAALAAAIGYLNSSLAGLLLDVANYTEASAMPMIFHTMRPWVPLLSWASVVAMVTVGVELGRWEPAMVPVAYLATVLALALGVTVRNHDRMVFATVVPARDAIEDGREDLGRVLHDEFGPIKAAAEGTAQIKEVPRQWATQLAALPAMLTYFHTRTGIRDSRQMSLDYLAEEILEPYGLWEFVSYDVSWGELSLGDHQTAITMATALLHNVGQALSKPEFAGHRRDIVLEGYSSGSGLELRYHLAVRDHLPPIDNWCPPRKSLTELRELLRTEHHGDLVQETLVDGSKRIVATWSDRALPAPLELFKWEQQ
ncbi:MAG: hypothetical protein H6523_11630 [Mycolicibacterium sp.]|nr:hypothetical protein [Mycolicibacterium sp.]